MWESGSWTGPVGQWIQLKFDAAGRPAHDQRRLRRQLRVGPPVTQVADDHRGGPGRPTRCRSPATCSRCGSRPGRPAGCASPSPAWPPAAGPPIGAQVGHLRHRGARGARPAGTIVAPRGPRSGDPSAVVLAKARAAALRVHAHLDALGLLACCWPPPPRSSSASTAPSPNSAEPAACTVRRSWSTHRWPTSSRASARRSRRSPRRRSFTGGPAGPADGRLRRESGDLVGGQRGRPAPHAAHPVGRLAHGEPADHRAAAGRVRVRSRCGSPGQAGSVAARGPASSGVRDVRADADEPLAFTFIPV